MTDREIDAKMRKAIRMQWETNAHLVEDTYGGYVDWEEEFYICPECGEPVYSCDWSNHELFKELCPICGFTDED